MSAWTGKDLRALRPDDRQALALERIATALEALVPLVRDVGDQLDDRRDLHDIRAALEAIGDELRASGVAHPELTDGETR